MNETLQDFIRHRARNTCEYCRLPQSFHPSPFQLDHIIAQQHHGPTSNDNLAWSCLRCNSHKGPNLSGFDWQTGAIVRLFHPRLDRWEEHFEWRGPYLHGLTQIGRITIDVLTMNHPTYVELRASLIVEGVFPAEI